MFLLLLLIATISLGDCANILCIIPTASFSHQIPFRPLWRKLSHRGHQLTLLTTDPMNDSTLVNITEIDLSFTYDIYRKHNFSNIASNESISFLEIRNVLMKMLNESSTAQLLYPPVQELINDKTKHFDLLITEGQTVTMPAFSWRFKCPWIGVTSMDAPLHTHEAMGNPTHPIINPDYNLKLEDPTDLTFKERIGSLIYNVLYKHFMYNDYFVREHEKLKNFFGSDLPPMFDILKNMSMLFVNANPIFYNVRALNPTTILIGDGSYLETPKPLPKDLAQFLDESRDGVIYFSLGSNVKSHLLNDTTIRAILDAFAELPAYKVLWKFDSEGMENVPSNVRIGKWFPQPDILRHPKVKLFITQGGLQSLQEALSSYVPLLCIPFFGDQIQNAQKMIKKGVAIKLDKTQISKDNFKNAILEVLKNPKYANKAKELGTILQDQPISGIDSAVWWTEYVLRHNGAKHLRSTAVDMPTYQKLLLDVIAFLLAVTLLPLYIFYKIVKYVFKKWSSKKVAKQKTS